MKIIIKALVVIVCAGLLIWNAGQLKAIEDGTHTVQIEYGKYTADATVGENCEAKILGLYPFGVEKSQESYGSFVVSTEVVAHYCLAVLEDYSIGAVKISAKGGELVGYDQWLIETEEDYLNVLLAEGFSIRGRTTSMPHFDSSMDSIEDYLGTIDEDLMDALEDYSSFFDDAKKEEEEMNQSLDGITLLDTTGDYPDSETIVPDLPTLEHEGIVITILSVAALMLAWDLLVLFEKMNNKRKARLAQQASANRSETLDDEFARTLIECSSAPVGDPTQAAEYALKKVLYFRNNGLPEQDLYFLEASICANIPEYVLQNYSNVFAIFNQDATPFWMATDTLIQQGKLAEAYKLSKPLVNHLEQNRSTMVAGYHSFKNIIEDRMYRHVNGYTLKTPVSLTKGNYAGLLVSHAKAIMKLSASLEELKGTEKKYLEMAQTLNNINSSAYWYMAQCVEQDESLWKENMDKALRFCYEKDGLYGLCQLYLHMGLHYMARKNEKLSAACFAFAVHYGDKETAVASRYLLSKTDAGGPMELKDAAAVLNENQIQVGYSQAVKEVAESLSDQPEAQSLIQHIQDDNIDQ